MAEKVWAKTSMVSPLTVYGQNIDAGCVFNIKAETGSHLAFSTFLKLMLDYDTTTSSIFLIDECAHEVLTASEGQDPELVDSSTMSVFSFVLGQMKDNPNKTYFIVTNGVEESPEIFDRLTSLLEAGKNVSIVLVHSPSTEPSFEDVIVRSLQHQMNSSMFKLLQYQN